jgi:hypothetical protein
MSFNEPFYDQSRASNPDVEAEFEEQTEQDLEQRAERYSELHPDGPKPSIATKVADRLRRLVGRGQ